MQLHGNASAAECWCEDAEGASERVDVEQLDGENVDSKAVRSGASGTTLASRWLVADGAAQDQYGVRLSQLLGGKGRRRAVSRCRG